jgi:hypothetical protein
MLGINVKRGIESTFDRVFQSTGGKFKEIKCTWHGSTAGINYRDGVCHVIFPSLRDTAEIGTPLFNRLVGYALHELGHAWFTSGSVWDDAVRDARDDGRLLGNLINGLEDPRIELAVINSGYAANARPLFESLTNYILDKGKPGDYVNPDDLQNVAFQLAIEGRRLNGYAISASPVWQRSKYAAAIGAALKSAHVAKNTKQIVLVAQRLLLALKQIDQQQPEPPQPPEEGEGGEDEAEGDPTGGGKGGNDEQRDFDVARAISADCAAVVEEKAYPNEGRITRRKIVFI